MLNSIYPHFKSDDIEIVKNCILCLIEITRNYYDSIAENLNELVEISKTFVKMLFNFLRQNLKQKFNSKLIIFIIYFYVF
jgi:hypothetical protein